MVDVLTSYSEVVLTRFTTVTATAQLVVVLCSDFVRSSSFLLLLKVLLLPHEDG